MPQKPRRGPAWWPIHVDAVVEPDGLRITGSQATDVVEPGCLLAWEVISNPEQPRVRDELGEVRKLGRRPIVLRVPNRGRPISIIRPAVTWFSHPDHRFRIVIRPGSRRRATIQTSALLLIALLVTSSPVLIGGGFVPVSGDAGEVGRRADMALNGFLLLCALGAVLAVLMSVRALWAFHRSWWAYELDERTIRFRRGRQTAEATWGELVGRRLLGTSLELLAADGRHIQLESTCPARWAVEARLPQQISLWTAPFVTLLCVTVIGPIGTLWLWRWLQLPPEAFGLRQCLGMQVLLLFPLGLYLLAYWLGKRGPTSHEKPSEVPE